MSWLRERLRLEVPQLRELRGYSMVDTAHARNICNCLVCAHV